MVIRPVEGEQAVGKRSIQVGLQGGDGWRGPVGFLGFVVVAILVRIVGARLIQIAEVIDFPRVLQAVVIGVRIESIQELLRQQGAGTEPHFVDVSR